MCYGFGGYENHFFKVESLKQAVEKMTKEQIDEALKLPYNEDSRQTLLSRKKSLELA